MVIRERNWYIRSTFIHGNVDYTFENTLNLMKKLNVPRTKFLREKCLHLFTVMLIVSFENMLNLMKKLHLSPRKFLRKRCSLKT